MFSNDTKIDSAFSSFGVELPNEADRPVWRFSMLMGIVWARGHALRANALPLPARYSQIPAVTERLILRDWLSKPDGPIDAGDPDWLHQVHERLRSKGRASVSVRHDKAALAIVFEALVLEPVQMEYLNVYPLLRAVTRTVDASELHLELQETI